MAQVKAEVRVDQNIFYETLDVKDKSRYIFSLSSFGDVQIMKIALYSISRSSQQSFSAECAEKNGGCGAFACPGHSI